MNFFVPHVSIDYASDLGLHYYHDEVNFMQKLDLTAKICYLAPSKKHLIYSLLQLRELINYGYEDDEEAIDPVWLELATEKLSASHAYD